MAGVVSEQSARLLACAVTHNRIRRSRSDGIDRPCFAGCAKAVRAEVRTVGV
jgi:hypothetical protein